MSKTKNNKQTFEFQTETAQLLDLMIHSLYSNSEIFLRELISNSSDAIDKLKFNSLKDGKLTEGKEELKISIDFDRDAKTITIKDDGIGMNSDEVMANIGTIANSGTKKFLQGMKSADAKDSNLIGQFGVGFYSAFIVAKSVDLITRKAGESVGSGVKWSSKGDGKYSLEEIKIDDFGTTVVLHLKDEHLEFADNYRLRGIISTYSDHITVPIQMLKPVADDDKDATIEYETVNKASAFWTREKSSIKKAEYNEFYKSLSYDFEDPLAVMHNKVEGKLEYTTLLYIPAKAPFDMYEPKRKGGIKLYAKRVFIMEDNENLMPLYLRFIKGVIDTTDLPLNVSREILQDSKVVDSIRKASVSRILKDLEKMSKNKPEDYAKFWDEFGMVLKEGVVEDAANKDKIAKLLRFATNKNNTQSATLDGYVKSMDEKQEDIYYITADSYEAGKNSPHMEIFNKKDIEVLILSDKVDEWLVSNFGEFEGKKLKSIAKGDIDNLDSADEKKANEEKVKDFDKVIQEAKKILEDRVQDVKISNRLSDSASVIVASEGDMGGNMERIMKSLGQDVPETKPILELNPEHSLVKKLKNKVDEDILSILFDQAVLSEGGQIKNPADFIKKINKLIG